MWCNLIHSFVFFLKTPQSARGFEADFMTVDEGAFQGADFFFRSIVPVALRDWSSVAIVTTPQGDSNYVSRLASMKNKDQNVIREDRNGRIRLEKQFADDIGLINVVHLGEPCEDCTSKGLADKCPHRELPPWKSRTRQTAYSEFLLKGREDDNLREQYAVIVKTTNNSFSELGIENLFTSTPHVTYNIPERIYIFVDPTGGGRSDFGITAGFWEKELVVRGWICMVDEGKEGTKKHM